MDGYVPSFAKVAREEGFTEIAGVFEAIAVAEKHEKRYKELPGQCGGSLQEHSGSNLALP